MKLLFINCAYPQECYNVLKENSNGMLNAAVNVFQWSVIDGLEQNDIDCTLACVPSLPAWPRYRHFFTPKGVMSVEGMKRGHYLRYLNLPALKQLSERRILRKYINQWCKKNKKEDKLVVLVYGQYVAELGAAIDLKRKYPNLIVASIITDLIDNAMDFSANHHWLKRIQVRLEEKGQRKIFPNVDKFILLTHQMTECIPEAKEKYIVVEGIAPKDSLKSIYPVNKDEKLRTLLYTGVLEKYAGVDQLVDAFYKTTNADFRLIVCGSGSSASHVKDVADKDSRIIYKGRVEREEAVLLQRESTLLINPRIPNGNITKYSFPSKTMEYMTSMTPMIGYHLEGIPEEYYEHMYTPKDLSVEALAECINETLSLPFETLQAKAIAATEFIAENKTSKAQVQRIVDFLNT